MVEQVRRRAWVVNTILFICLIVPALLAGSAGWPVRLTATAALVGACVWEAAALRARRFPLWADVLETAAVAVIAWRYPTGMGLLIFVLAFALPALGFRMLYSSPWQAAARTMSVIVAVYAGSIANASTGRRLPLVVGAVLVALLGTSTTRLLRLRETVAHRRRIAATLETNLAAAKGRSDVHAAILQAVLDSLPGRTDVRVIIWDEADSLRPTAASGTLAGEVRTAGGQPLSVVPWVRDALVFGESVYRESFDLDEMSRALGFDPFPGVLFFVPLRHREEIRALSVCAREPIPAPDRVEIESLAKIGEIALGSIELTGLSMEGLAERSYSDPATRLGNRALLQLRLKETLAEPGRLAALLLLHIDHSRTINDPLGNMADGEALATLAGRLVGCVGPSDTVARIGRDEFAILLHQLPDPATAEQIAGRILAVLDDPLPSIVVGSRTGMYIRGTIGVAVSGPAGRTLNELLRNADVAMDQAIAAGGGGYQVFEPAMRDSILDQLELESDLSLALDRHELVVHYQPIVPLLVSQRISGVEALIRWHHPRRGMIAPDRFIPAAEETGLINQIGAWVLREGCLQLRAWAATQPELARLSLSVNLSPVQLAQTDTASMIGQTIDEVGVDPRQVVVELTESALVENTTANLGKLQALKSLGLDLALDDFGTGFSSLGYLRQFPFDQVKIDRSFVHGVDVDDGAAALASSIIKMTKALNLRCVAEGVETASQANWLANARCDAAQGYFFARPMPAEQLPAFVNDT